MWLALDADTGEMIGAHVGHRGRDSAQQPWRSLPSGYRQGAVLDTDAWEAYQGGCHPNGIEWCPKTAANPAILSDATVPFVSASPGS
ncbi:MAG: hypothetical protein IGR92_17850 [Leptolyngbyaceae cyanobacterium T60_A2020_046]|nr:hypothetical protein [Leptolyngbyaceae cyanobacterium T60_A2020_046]